jgi:hypothetical protein
MNPLGKADHLTLIMAPAQCVSNLVSTYTEYLKITQQEQTKRQQIQTWEQTNLAQILTLRSALITYLERAFDERKIYFQEAFIRIDQAMLQGDNQQLALLLDNMVQVAQSSPFKDLANLAQVQAALADPNHVWEI